MRDGFHRSKSRKVAECKVCGSLVERGIMRNVNAKYWVRGDVGEREVRVQIRLCPACFPPFVAKLESLRWHNDLMVPPSVS